MRVIDTFLSQNVLAFVTVRVCVCAYAAKREACVWTYLCVFVYQHVQECRQWDIKIQKRKIKKESWRFHQPQQCTNVWIRLSLRRPQIASSKRQPITSVAISTDSCRVFIPCVWEPATFNLKRQSKKILIRVLHIMSHAVFSVWKAVHQKTREPGSIREKECRRSISGLLVLL